MLFFCNNLSMTKKGYEKLFLEDSNQKEIDDVVLANLIVFTAVFVSVLIPVLSLGLPFLVLIYLEIGLFGFVLEKEKGRYVKYEQIFTPIKQMVKIFCMAVVKIFVCLFWTIFFIVPGVISLLNYAFTPLIAYESSELDVKGVLMLSKEMTKGYRWRMFFYVLLALASVCVCATLMFLIIMLFDVWFVVPAVYYIIFVVFAGIIDLILLGLPLLEFAIVDCYILSKKSKQNLLPILNGQDENC